MTTRSTAKRIASNNDFVTFLNELPEFRVGELETMSAELLVVLGCEKVLCRRKLFAGRPVRTLFLVRLFCWLHVRFANQKQSKGKVAYRIGVNKIS